MDIIVVPFLLILKLLIGLAMTVVIADVILSWLVSLKIINMENQFVYSVVDIISRAANVMLNPVRSRASINLGSLDISPIIILILLTFLEHVITRILMRFM